MLQLGTELCLVAEAASNHDGNVEKACDLVRAAKRSGASVVKFQLGIESLTAESNPLHSEFQRLALSYGDWDKVRAVARRVDIDWTASVWSKEAAEYLASTDAPFVKVGSGDITNDPTLRWAARTGRDLVLSTGMATVEEIEHALRIWEQDSLHRPGGRVVLLACSVSYPAQTDDAHVARIDALSKRFVNSESSSLVVGAGYSSHCDDWRVPAFAARRGACVIEAHFALEHLKDSSLSPGEFTDMVAVAKGYVDPPWDSEWELRAWGTGKLGILPCELDWVGVARRDEKTGLRV